MRKKIRSLISDLKVAGERLFLNKRRAAHICALNRNVGDNALILAIRQMLAEHFHFQHVEILGNKFPPNALRTLERNDVIIFGGGGLIHSFGPRGNPLERTGTLWDIDLKDLAKLSKPIVLYGVGFNHFYGDPPPLPAMREMFNVLVEKKSLIAFRNDGSEQRFLKYFPEFSGEIGTIPDPGIFFRPVPPKKGGYVVLQIAADRVNLRFGSKFDAFIKFIQELIGKIKQPVKLVPHTPDDERLYREIGPRLKVEVIPFLRRGADTHKMIGLYAGADFSISTRGHSQICSIGNSIPTFSISTHPKVEAFAAACGVSDWCFNLDREDFDIGRAKFADFQEKLPEIRAYLDDLNQGFDRQVTVFNEKILNLVETI